MRIRTLKIALPLALLFVPPASADMKTYTASRDATMFSENIVGANGKGFLFAGNTDAGYSRRAILRFDITGIPAGATIDSVFVTLFMSRTSSGASTVSMHRALQSWTEGNATGTGTGNGRPSAIGFLDVTWRFASFPSDTFTTAGGVFAGSASAAVPVAAVGLYTWSSPGLVADVEAWRSAPSTNYGWFILGDESVARTSKRFDSREQGTAPGLTVYYSTGTSTQTGSWGRVKSRYVD